MLTNSGEEKVRQRYQQPFSIPLSLSSFFVKAVQYKREKETPLLRFRAVIRLFFQFAFLDQVPFFSFISPEHNSPGAISDLLLPQKIMSASQLIDT